MTFEEKAIESLEASEILRENKKYNSCVNRAYYSLYQRVLGKLEDVKLLDKVNKEFKEQVDEPKKGSHEFTIDYYINKEFSRRVKGRQQVIKANNCAYSLKKLRHRADYRNDDISEIDVIDAIKFAKLFKDLVSSK